MVMSMKNKRLCAELGILPENRLPFLLLLIAGGMEFLFIAMESLFSYLGYYLAEELLILPALLFVGWCLAKKPTGEARRDLQLSALAIGWFLIVQIIHEISGMDGHPMGTVLFVYLMAFPFASVTEDRKNLGLTLIGKLFTVASLVLVVYTGMLLLDCVPGFMEPYVYWDGARLHVFWHSNMSACFFMIGIGFCCAFFTREKNLGKRIFLGIAVVLQFVAMALTNCRTTLLMTAAFFGGIAFFVISKGGWKRFALGLAAALLIMVTSFTLTSKIYELHNDILLEKITAQVQAEKAAEATAPAETEAASQETEPAQTRVENYVVDQETGEVKIKSQNKQKSLGSDMKTLNGRTKIWKSAYSAMRDNKRILLWGTEYVGTAISVYNSFEVVHAHNSWMEMLMKEGLPGLLIALIYTWIAVRSGLFLLLKGGVSLEKKILAMLTLCILVTGFLEPYLFITNVYYHVMDFAFFFCTGYLKLWQREARTTV